MADILEEAATEAFITRSALTRTLQRYMLPQLTPDALIVLRTTCKALHHLVTTAPFEALQRTLQTLLPPAVRHCATDSHSMKALLGSQRALQQCLQDGAEARLQKLSISDLENPEGDCWGWATRPSWALESPCRRLILECGNDNYDYDQVVLDLQGRLASDKCPAAMWLSQEDVPWGMLSFVRQGVLLKSASGLAILDMDTLELTSTWSCPEGCSPHKPELVSGLICVNVLASGNSTVRDIHTRSVVVLEQSSLRERLVIRPPMRPIPNGTAASKRTAELICKLMQPSPDQQHIAVHWRDAAHWRDADDSSCSRLCIYSLLSGLCVADFDCQAVLGSHGKKSRPRWSPNSLQILFPEVQHSDGVPPSFTGTMVADVSGSYRMLTASANWRTQVASWSANGNYIYVNGKSRAAQHSERQSFCSSVWQAKTGQEVLSWEDPSDASLAAWSPVGSSIFLPDLTLMVLPADESPAEIIRQTYHGPRCLGQNTDTWSQDPMGAFSPSGRMFVGAWPSNACPSPLRLLQELWHADCSPASSSGPMKLVATDDSGWVIASIVWNPSPQTAHVYAIITHGGSLHLIDSEQHRSLRSWSRQELAGPIDTHHTVQLSWSSDGSQLLASEAYGCISLLTFGLAACNAPADA